MQSKGYTAEFLKYASFNVLGMLGLSCYILADTFFVANGVGADGLAALNLALPVYSLVHGSGLMLGMGGATRFSILKENKNRQTVDALFAGTVRMAFFLALLYMTAGLFGAEALARLLGGEGAVLEMTATYLKWILLFAPCFMMNDVLICFVRNDGNPRLSMAAMLGGSMMNILLDYIFIFPMEMGIFGAVLATGLAPMISMSILSVHRLKGQCGFRWSRGRLGTNAAAALISLGIPSLVAEVSSGVVIIVFNFIILGLHGNVGVAAYGIIANLSLVVTAVYTGIAQGMQPLLSAFYGRGEREGIRKVLRCGLLSAAAVSVVLYLGIFVFSEPIASLFNSEGNGQLQEMAVWGLRLYFPASVFVGINILSAMYFASTEKALPAQIISVARGLVIIIPMAFLLSAVWGMTGVWLSFPAAEALVSLMAAGMLVRSFRPASS